MNTTTGTARTAKAQDTPATAGTARKPRDARGFLVDAKAPAAPAKAAVRKAPAAKVTAAKAPAKAPAKAQGAKAPAARKVAAKVAAKAAAPRVNPQGRTRVTRAELEALIAAQVKDGRTTPGAVRTAIRSQGIACTFAIIRETLDAMGVEPVRQSRTGGAPSAKAKAKAERDARLAESAAVRDWERNGRKGRKPATPALDKARAASATMANGAPVRASGTVKGATPAAKVTGTGAKARTARAAA